MANAFPLPAASRNAFAIRANDLSPLAKAITRHKAAYAAFLDTFEDEESVRAGTIEFAALEEVARAPVASDAEALAKLRYLFKMEAREYGNEPSMSEAFGSVAVALAEMFKDEA